jgi:uncharacterized protein YggE
MILAHRYILVLFLCCSTFISSAQITGNQIYNKNNYSTSVKLTRNSIQTNANGLTITSQVLLNKLPNSFIVTLGVNQEALTVKACNTKINARISNLKKALKTLGLEGEDFYVDFITQTKIYDYNIESSKALQYQKGFEIKKNLIVKLKNSNDIDAVIELSSEQEIYDVIKVDYINDSEDEVYETLFNECIKIVEQRKKIYSKLAKPKFKKATHIVSDQFYSVHPKSQYKQYQAVESSNLSVTNRNYSAHYVKKEARKNKTFYYEGENTSAFDKVIGTISPKIGIQYVMSLTVSYEFDTKKEKH